MIGVLGLLLSCQLLGEVLVVATGLPLPGPVVGMAALFLGLLVKGGLPEGLDRVGSGLLQHLSLLFVPAGVGVMLHLTLIADEWIAISVALVASTLLAIAVTALVMVTLNKLLGRGANGKGEGAP